MVQVFVYFSMFGLYNVYAVYIPELFSDSPRTWTAAVTFPVMPGKPSSTSLGKPLSILFLASSYLQKTQNHKGDCYSVCHKLSQPFIGFLSANSISNGNVQLIEKQMIHSKLIQDCTHTYSSSRQQRRMSCQILHHRGQRQLCSHCWADPHC